MRKRLVLIFMFRSHTPLAKDAINRMCGAAESGASPILQLRATALMSRMIISYELRLGQALSVIGRGREGPKTFCH